MPFDSANFDLPTNDTIRALEKARAYMDEHGWCQGEYIEDDGRVCLLGAAFLGNGIDLWSNYKSLPVYIALDYVASERGFDNPPCLNDDALTSKAEALAVFDEAIELERARIMEKADAV